MVGISVNKQDVVLPDDFLISVEINNPALDQDIIQGDYTLPSAVPYRGNARQFKFNWELLLKSRTKSYANVDLKFKRWKLFSGILDVLNINNDTINTSIRLNISGLLSVSKKLRDFDYGSIFIGDDQGTRLDFILNQILEGFPVNNFNFPMIYHPDFYGEKNPDYLGFINNYDAAAGAFIPNTASNVNTIVPMLYLFHVLKTCFEFDGYTLLDEAFMAEEIQQKLMIYNNYAIDKRETVAFSDGMHSENSTHDTLNQTLQTIIFDNDNDGQDNYDPLNLYDNTTGEYTIGSTGSFTVNARIRWEFGTNNVNGSSSTVTVNIMLNGSQVAFGFQNYPYGTTFGDLSANWSFVAGSSDVGSIIKVQVIFSNTSNPAQTITLRSGTVFSVNSNRTVSLNNFKNTIELREHLPDITFGELINALRGTFNIMFNINNKDKTVRIDYFDEIYNLPRVQFKSSNYDRSLFGHTVHLTNEYVYKLFNFTFETDDDLVNDNFKPFDANKLIGGYMSYNHLNAAYPATATLKDKYAIIFNINQVWKCNEPTTGTFAWEYYTDNYKDFVVDPLGSVENKPALSPMFMIQLVDHNATDDYAIFPHIKQRGSSDEFEIGTNDPSLRLFYFHGNTLGGTIHNYAGAYYPFSTTMNIKYDGSALSNRKFDWPLGLHPLWQNKISIFAKGEYYEKKVQLNLVDFLNFNSQNPCRIDNADFLIKNMRTDFDQEIGPSTFTLFKF